MEGFKHVKFRYTNIHPGYPPIDFGCMSRLLEGCPGCSFGGICRLETGGFSPNLSLRQLGRFGTVCFGAKPSGEVLHAMLLGFLPHWTEAGSVSLASELTFEPLGFSRAILVKVRKG